MLINPPTCLGFMLIGAALSTPAQAAGTPADACGWLTPSQISAELGIPVDAGVRPIASEPGMCNWRERNKPTGPGRNVMLTIITEKEFNRMKDLPLASPADGIGDEAVMTHPMHVPAELSVKAGTHYFQLLVRSDVVPSEEADARNQAIEKKLAAKIIKKLG